MNYKTIFHWMALAAYAYIFGKAALLKVISDADMMDGMLAIGFGREWTLVIGWLELIGIAGIITGIFFPTVKIIFVCCLMPFAWGAFAIHMSHHHSFHDFNESLMVCILSAVILWTDHRFKICLV